MALDYIERVVWDATDTDDVFKLTKNASPSDVLEAQRKVQFMKALQQAEARIETFKAFSRYGVFKTLLICSLSGFFGYLFQSKILFYTKIFLTHKAVAPIIIAIIIGYTLTYTTSLGYFSVLFPVDYSTSQVKNVLIDFFKTFNITKDEEEGEYCTLDDIIITINDNRGNLYSHWQIEEFLKRQSLIVKKEDKYLLSASEI